MEDVDILPTYTYSHMVYFTAILYVDFVTIWYIFYGYFVYSYRFGMLLREKSGYLATQTFW
jgi:hypothetical protein